jgi:hypothetical protein
VAADDSFRIADNPRTWVRRYERVYRHGSNLESPDMFVTAHDLLEATVRAKAITRNTIPK